MYVSSMYSYIDIYILVKIIYFVKKISTKNLKTKLNIEVIRIENKLKH